MQREEGTKRLTNNKRNTKVREEEEGSPWWSRYVLWLAKDLCWSSWIFLKEWWPMESPCKSRKKVWARRSKREKLLYINLLHTPLQRHIAPTLCRVVRLVWSEGPGKSEKKGVDLHLPSQFSQSKLPVFILTQKLLNSLFPHVMLKRLGEWVNISLLAKANWPNLKKKKQKGFQQLAYHRTESVNVKLLSN